LQRADDAVACRREVAKNDVAALLAAEVQISAHHLFDHVTIADFGADNFPAVRRERFLETGVTERASQERFNSKTPIMVPGVLARKAARALGVVDASALRFAARIPSCLWLVLLLALVFAAGRRVSPTAGALAAIAAALEDEVYPIDDLVFDLANIRAGPRFAGEDSHLAGRLGARCQQIYERADHPGYLEMGVPVQYGAGASEVVREVVTNAGGRYKLTSDLLRHGDIERALMEWRSLLRHIVAAPELDWPRWQELKAVAGHFLENTKPATSLDFPPLLAAQQRGGGF